MDSGIGFPWIADFLSFGYVSLCCAPAGQKTAAHGPISNGAGCPLSKFDVQAGRLCLRHRSPALSGEGETGPAGEVDAGTIRASRRRVR